MRLLLVTLTLIIKFDLIIIVLLLLFGFNFSIKIDLWLHSHTTRLTLGGGISPNNKFMQVYHINSPKPLTPGPLTHQALLEHCQDDMCSIKIFKMVFQNLSPPHSPDGTC